MNQLQNFVAGQIIKIRYSLYIHYAVISDCIGPDGYPMVIDNSAATGTITERSWSEATKDRPVTLSDLKSEFSPQEVLACAKSMLGKRGYSLMNFNCESFVRETLGLLPTSKQVVTSTVVVPTAMYTAHRLSGGNKWITGLVGVVTLAATTHAVAE